MAILIETNNSQREVEPKNGKDFSLEELQGYIGGYIEIVETKDGYIVVDEEGLLKNLPVNPKASNLAGGLIVGNALVCKRSQIK